MQTMRYGRYATWFVCAGYYFGPLPGQIWLYGSFRIAVQQYGNFRVTLDIFTKALRELYILHNFLKFLISRDFQEHLKLK